MDKRSFGPHAFFLIPEYDSRKPWEKANYLESIGCTAADIERLRALRDSPEAGPAPESPRRGEARADRARSPRRPRVAGRHPRNRNDTRHPSGRRRGRAVVLVIVVIGLD